MYLEQGYKRIGVNPCAILRRCAGKTACHEVVKATWIRKPAQDVPKEVMKDFEAKKAGLKPLKLARDNCARPDQAKSNIDKAIRCLYRTKKCLPFCMNQAQQVS